MNHGPLLLEIEQIHCKSRSKINNLFTYTPYIDAPHRSSLGSHLCERRMRRYFDSFTRCHNAYFERYRNRNCSSWTFNNKHLQSVVSEFVDIIVFAIVNIAVD